MGENMEQIPFLANIVLVAHADGTLSANEMGQIEAIRKEFGIKKGDYQSALKLIEGGNYKLTPTGTFADQVKNLELILRVALADSDLEESETELIKAFCKMIGIHQEQLNKLYKEVLVSVKDVGKICPSCGAENSSESLFCAKCGKSLDVIEKDIQVKIDIPRNGIAIEFAESSAADFPKAFEIASKTSGFQKCLKGKKTWYLGTFPSGEILEALPLADALSGIRNRKVYINGEEIPWQEIFGFVWCASQRNTAYRPIEYCFGKDDNRINPWGCKQAQMDWSDWADWFCYGRWEKIGFMGQKFQWVFDKERIKHELATHLYRFRYCPYLNTKLSESVLQYLPDKIEIGSDPNWDYHANFTEVPGALKIILKEKDADMVFTREFWADGVKPKGLQVLVDILLKAYKDLGIETDTVRALMK